MYPKQLFNKVLDLVDNDIAIHFRSIPGEPFKDEEKFPVWDFHDPMIMQITRDLRKIAHTTKSEEDAMDLKTIKAEAGNLEDNLDKLLEEFREKTGLYVTAVTLLDPHGNAWEEQSTRGKLCFGQHCIIKLQRI